MTRRRARRDLRRRVRRLGQDANDHGIENEDGWMTGPGTPATTEESSK